MFVRKKINKSGVVSIQLIQKVKGKSKLVKTIGSSLDPKQIEQLFLRAKDEVERYGGQQVLDFTEHDDALFLLRVKESIEQIQLIGPELILGKLYDEIGFNRIKEKEFRHLVITRIIYPGSKLRMVDYVQRHTGVHLEIDKVYRFMDKLSSRYKQQVEQISFAHTKALLGEQINVVFYDVTTLYFEASDEDDLRRTGFSKDGKHQHPQILLGLLVSQGGYPLAYEIFEGNKFEGHTMLPVFNEFRKRYKIKKLIMVADAGLLSNENIQQLKLLNQEFIIGARLKNEPKLLQEKILSQHIGNGKSICIDKTDDTKLIVSYSETRAKKDKANRAKGLKKLERAIAKGKLTKHHINNRGYNKYLKLEGEISIKIDYKKYRHDAKWDGLKGYLTNTSLNNNEVIENYKHLWQIEKAFRISKTDLKIRPVYHYRKHRIQAHICVAFCAYKLYKELERRLQQHPQKLSPEKAIEIIKSIYAINLILPQSKNKTTLLLDKTDEQKNLLKFFQVNFG